MKRYVLFLLMSGLVLAASLTSCGYDEYAEADYPETMVYQPMAFESIWSIDAPNPENPSPETPGGPKKYDIDKVGNKFIVYMGVAQSGIERKSFTVNVAADPSVVSAMIADGTLPADTEALPASAFSLPATVELSASTASAPFRMEIDLSALTGANAGKKLAVAVTISSPSVKVNEDMDTAVIYIDTAFIQALL